MSPDRLKKVRETPFVAIAAKAIASDESPVAQTTTFVGPHVHEPLRQSSEFVFPLEQLLEARRGAEMLQMDRWTLAVEIATLLSVRCTPTMLRLLVGAGYIEHAEDVTLNSDERRCFRAESPMTFGPHTCFVLTDAGVSFLASIQSPTKPPDLITCKVPHWNADARELWADHRLVKRFTRPAPMLELVLSSFQELCWPAHLDDPLPPEPGIVPDERLRDTVRRLNKCQTLRVLRFTSDGLGAGIRWTWAERETTDEPRLSRG